MGCQITPEDKWPVIVGKTTPNNITVTMELGGILGIIVNIPDFTFEIKTNVRTYHANQDFTVRIWLMEVVEYYTPYLDNLPLGTQCRSQPSDWSYAWSPVEGRYISGTPPQGIVELAVKPDWVPVPGSVADWVEYERDPDTNALTLKSVTQKYVYHFRVLVEDAAGRSDSFTFEWTATLKLD